MSHEGLSIGEEARIDSMIEESIREMMPRRSGNTIIRVDHTPEDHTFIYAAVNIGNKWHFTGDEGPQRVFGTLSPTTEELRDRILDTPEDFVIFEVTRLDDVQIENLDKILKD